MPREMMFTLCSDRCRNGIRLKVLLVILVLVGLSIPASASLGGSIASVDRDNTIANGSLHTAEGERYTIYEIKISTWATVREFVSPAGTVFAVCWQGRFVPDLKQFLGMYFEKYSAAVQAQKYTSFSRRPFRMRLPNFVIETGGHMGSRYGRAFDPQLLPDGISEQEIN